MLPSMVRRLIIWAQSKRRKMTQETTERAIGAAKRVYIRRGRRFLIQISVLSTVVWLVRVLPRLALGKSKQVNSPW